MTILMGILLILLGFILGIQYERYTGDFHNTKLGRERDRQEFIKTIQRWKLGIKELNKMKKDG